MPRLSLISFTAQQPDSAFLLHSCLKLSPFSLEYFASSSSGLLLTVPTVNLHFLASEWLLYLLIRPSLPPLCLAAGRQGAPGPPGCPVLQPAPSPPKPPLLASITSLHQFVCWKTVSDAYLFVFISPFASSSEIYSVQSSLLWLDQQ